MDEKERNWLMGQLREADAIGDIERANKIADILRGGGPQPQGPTQEMLREGEVITDPAAEQAQIRAQWREEEPLPSVPSGDEASPEDVGKTTSMLTAITDKLYPGRSTEWMEDAFVGGSDRFLASEGQAIKQGATDIVRDRNNWRLVGDVGGWAAATLGTMVQGPAALEPASTAAQLAVTGPTLASTGSLLMDNLYSQFMTEGIDLEEMTDAHRSSLIWNSVFSVLPTMASAVKETAAKFLTGSLGAKTGRAQEEMRAWLDEVWMRYQMVKGDKGTTPDPSASGRSRLVTSLKALGKLPVFVGTWFQVRREQNIAKSLDWYAGKLEDLAPVIDADTIGVKFANDAEAMGRWMLQSITGMYDDLYKAAEPLDKSYATRGGIVPTQALKDYAETLGQKIGLPIRGKPHYSAEEMAEYARTGDIPKRGEMDLPKADDWERWVVQNFSDVTNFTTLERIRNLKMVLSNAVRRTKNDPAIETESLRGALRAVQEAIEEMRISGLASPDSKLREVANKSQFVDDYFGEVMGLMERGAGKRFHALDRDFWDRAHLMGNYNSPGNNYADEMFEVAFSTNSKGFLKDLRQLVGDEAYNVARRKYLADSFDSAFIPDEAGDAIFNVKRFRDLLQMDGKPGVFAELMKDTGITRQQMEHFIKNLGDYPITFNAAQMQVRRIAIGGPKAVMTGIQPASMFGTGTQAAGAGLLVNALGLVKPIIGAIMVRSAGRLATSPWAFRQLARFAEKERKYFTGKLSEAQYLLAVDKVLRYFPEDTESIPLEDMRSSDWPYPRQQ